MMENYFETWTQGFKVNLSSSSSSPLTSFKKLSIHLMDEEDLSKSLKRE